MENEFDNLQPLNACRKQEKHLMEKHCLLHIIIHLGITDRSFPLITKLKGTRFCTKKLHIQQTDMLIRRAVPLFPQLSASSCLMGFPSSFHSYTIKQQYFWKYMKSVCFVHNLLASQNFFLDLFNKVKPCLFLKRDLTKKAA